MGGVGGAGALSEASGCDKKGKAYVDDEEGAG